MLIFCLAVVFLFFIVYMGLQMYIKNKLIAFLENKDFDSFYNLLGTTKAQVVLPPYNIEYMKLNGYMMQNRKKEIDHQFTLLLRAKKNKQQTQDLLQRGLQYYIDRKDSRKCHLFLDEMKNVMGTQVMKEATYMVDILVDGKSCFIEEMKEKLNSVSENQKPVYYYLIQKQYENCHDMKNAKLYEDLCSQWKERK